MPDLSAGVLLLNWVKCRQMCGWPGGTEEKNHSDVRTHQGEPAFSLLIKELVEQGAEFSQLVLLRPLLQLS